MKETKRGVFRRQSMQIIISCIIQIGSLNLNQNILTAFGQGKVIIMQTEAKIRCRCTILAESEEDARKALENGCVGDGVEIVSSETVSNRNVDFSKIHLNQYGDFSFSDALIDTMAPTARA